MQNEMNITDGAVKVKRKRGDVREDGMVFFRYKNGKEIWLDSVEFEKARTLQLIAAKRYAQGNVEKRRASAKHYRSNHRDKHIQRTKKWRAENLEKVKAYNEANRKRHAISNNRARMKRYRSDPHFALICKYRALIRYAFKRANTNKASKSIDILGCSPEEFIKHIESQFYGGMSWDSFNQKNEFGRCVVEIDHIVPISLSSTEEDIRKFSHYSNLRPMWWWENQAKRNKMPDEA